MIVVVVVVAAVVVAIIKMGLKVQIPAVLVRPGSL